jgi:hypothetical protein
MTKPIIPWTQFIGYCPRCNYALSGRDVPKEKMKANNKTIDMENSMAECLQCGLRARIKKLSKRIQLPKSSKGALRRDPFYFWKDKNRFPKGISTTEKEVLPKRKTKYVRI